MKNTIIRIMVLIFLVSSLASAEIELSDNNYFQFAKIYINTTQIANNFSQYNDTDIPSDMLEFYINQSLIRFSATQDIELKNISFINYNWTYTGIGTGGYLNTTIKLNSSILYNLSVDNIITQNRTSDSNGWVWFNYSVNGQHSFLISSTVLSSIRLNISSWGNNYTNDETLNFSIYSNKSQTVNFYVTTNEILDSDTTWFFNSSSQTQPYNNFTYNFSINGTTPIIFSGYNISSDSFDLKRWYITYNYVPDILIIPTPTPTSTPTQMSCSDYKISRGIGVNATHDQANQATIDYSNGIINNVCVIEIVNSYLGSPTPTPTPTPTSTPTPTPSYINCSIYKTNNGIGVNATHDQANQATIDHNNGIIDTACVIEIVNSYIGSPTPTPTPSPTLLTYIINGDIIGGIIQTGNNATGGLMFLIIGIGIVGSLYVKSQKITIPLMIGILYFVLAMDAIPKEMQYIIKAFLVLSIAVIAFKLWYRNNNE